MNWEAIGAVGELVGAFVVVVTLLYLAISIRQNSKSISISALRDATVLWHQWSEILASSSDLADIVARGNLEYTSLSASEALRYGAYIQSFFDNVESYRILVIEHNLDKDLETLVSITGRRINIPGFASWWELNTADYNEDFISWIEGIRNDFKK
jgi:hypothetical protein